MAQWSANDAASDSPMWGPAKYGKAPTRTLANTLYGNTTADAFVTGQTIGVYGVDSTEIAVGAKYLASAAANGVGTGGSYIPGDVLTVENTGATQSVGATMTVATTKVRTVAATAASGTGYANGDTLTCNTGTMTTNAVFTVTTGASNTSVASLALTTNGVFTVNPTLATSPLKSLTGAGTGATATLTMAIASLAVQNPGVYTVVPTDVVSNDVTGGSGTGANVFLTFATASKGITHTGWVVRTTGTGGRAGRVQNEVLVAGGINTDNNSDDTVYPDA
jgi:hypothetical protein